MEDTVRILIADHFPAVRGELRELLHRYPDMEVAGEAASGEEIVELARRVSCDLILMDIEMEDINAGIYAAEKIRRELPLVQVIFLTAHDTKEMIVKAMGAGAVDYLVKGCEEEELVHHIRCAAEGNPVMQSRIHETVMQEYMRLQKSEKSLLYFINNFANLTTVEKELIQLLLKEYKVSEIAGVRGVASSTVKTQVKGLLRKFGCRRTKEITGIIRNLNIEHLFG